MKPLYVLVHEHLILKPVQFLSPQEDVDRWNELQRILKEEEYVRVTDDPGIIPEGLPNDRQIRVCGGLRTICVQHQLDALHSAGYSASLHLPATQG